MKKEGNKMIMSSDDMLEAIVLYCDKHNIIYDSDIICWQIDKLDKFNAGNSDSTFKIILEWGGKMAERKKFKLTGIGKG